MDHAPLQQGGGGHGAASGIGETTAVTSRAAAGARCGYGDVDVGGAQALEARTARSGSGGE